MGRIGKTKKVKKNYAQLLPLLIFVFVLVINFFVSREAKTQDDGVCLYGSDGKIDMQFTIPNRASYYESGACDYGYYYTSGDLLFEYYGTGSDSVGAFPYGRKGSVMIGGNLVARNNGLLIGDYDSAGYHWVMTGLNEPDGNTLGFLDKYDEIWYINNESSEPHNRQKILTRYLIEGYDFAEAFLRLIVQFDGDNSMLNSIPPAMNSLYWGDCDDDDNDSLCSEAEDALGLTERDMPDTDNDGIMDAQDVYWQFYDAEARIKTNVNDYKDLYGRFVLNNKSDYASSGLPGLWYVHPLDFKRYYIPRMYYSENGSINAGNYSKVNSYIKSISGINMDIISENNPMIKIKKSVNGLVYFRNDLILGDDLKIPHGGYDYRASPFCTGNICSTDYSKGITFQAGNQSVKVGSYNLTGGGLKRPGKTTADKARVEGLLIASMKKASEYLSNVRDYGGKLLVSTIPFCGNEGLSAVAGCSYRELISGGAKVEGLLVVSGDIHLMANKEVCFDDETKLDAFTAHNYTVNPDNEKVIGYGRNTGTCSSADYQEHFKVCTDNLGKPIGTYSECGHKFNEWINCKCPNYVTTIDENGVINTRVIQ